MRLVVVYVLALPSRGGSADLAPRSSTSLGCEVCATGDRIPAAAGGDGTRPRRTDGLSVLRRDYVSGVLLPVPKREGPFEYATAAQPALSVTLQNCSHSSYTTSRSPRQSARNGVDFYFEKRQRYMTAEGSRGEIRTRRARIHVTRDTSPFSWAHIHS